MTTNYLEAPTGLKIANMTGDLPAAAAAEVGGAETAEALALTVDSGSNPDMTYSATAEDNGTAGALDGEPGVIYSGPAGATNALRVTAKNVDVTEGTIAPEATDLVSVGVAVNSDIVAIADEGFVAQTGSALEFNVDTIVAVNTSDVVRLVLLAQSSGENAQDWDVAEGGEWSIV